MVFYYKTNKGFVSPTVWENRLRFNFETFITFSAELMVNKLETMRKFQFFQQKYKQYKHSL